MKNSSRWIFLFLKWLQYSVFLWLYKKHPSLYSTSRTFCRLSVPSLSQICCFWNSVRISVAWKDRPWELVAVFWINVFLFPSSSLHILPKYPPFHFFIPQTTVIPCGCWLEFGKRRAQDTPWLTYHKFIKWFGMLGLESQLFLELDL